MDAAYMRTKEVVKQLVKNSSSLSLIVDESDNQTGERILNMCVLLQNKQSYHAVSESAGSMKLTARNVYGAVPVNPS